MLVRNSKKFTNHEVVEKMIGSLRKDKDRLRATSPRRQASEIEIPILLAHGDEDRVVPIEQSEVMAKALEKAGKTFTFIVLEDGDHHLSKQDHRLRLFRIMDMFLAKHLAEPAEELERPVQADDPE